MHETAIELLVIGSSASEMEGYLTSLRNAGIAVHGRRVGQDPEALADDLEEVVDLIYYSADPDALTLPRVMELVTSKGLDLPIIVLTDSYQGEAKAQAMGQGAADLLERNQHGLLVEITRREYARHRLQQERRALSQQLAEAEERCNTLSESSHDAIAYIHEGMHVKVNPTYLKLFGLQESEEVEGLPILDVILPAEHGKLKKILRKLGSGGDQRAELTTTCVRDNGEEFSAELSFLSASIDGEPCNQVIIRDLSRSREVEEKLQLLSTLDTQTGLFNRQHFLDLLDASLAATPSGQSLFYITLDNFKGIRDNAGIQASDRVINEVADLLREIAADSDLLARFGDHTFTLLTQGGGNKQLCKLGHEICRQVKAHGYADTIPLQPSCSIGIVGASNDVRNANEFINRAYQACEQARIQGGDQPFLAEVSREKEEELTGSEADLVNLIHHALEHSQFRLVYQPIVSLHGDTRETYAVLVRLLDNNQDEIHPDHFMAQMASLGKLAEMDRWVIRTAISELAKHRQEGKKVIFFVNISGQSLEDDTLLLWICDCLREYEAKGSWFVFQVAEEDARTHLQEMKKLTEGLAKIKCKVSIDHFDLESRPELTINNLPVDFVQFDPRVLNGLAEDQIMQDRFNGLNRAIQDSGIKTIAAGVEETNSLAILWSVGVNYIRGYFIQEPSISISYDFKPEALIQ